MNDLERLDLAKLGDGLPAITPAYGQSLAEAGAVCLESQGHEVGVDIAVEGDFTARFNIHWGAVTDQMRRCWKDAEYATEQAAYGIAFLIVQQLTDYTVIERSIRGTGFDYWLGIAADELPFERRVRLEVSGVLQGTTGRVNARVKEKVVQANRYASKLPAYVVVVEFSQPQARMVQQ